MKSASFSAAEIRFTKMYFSLLKPASHFLFLIKAPQNASINNFNSYYKLYNFVLNLSFSKMFSDFYLNAGPSFKHLQSENWSITSKFSFFIFSPSILNLDNFLSHLTLCFALCFDVF